MCLVHSTEDEYKLDLCEHVNVQMIKVLHFVQMEVKTCVKWCNHNCKLKCYNVLF